MGCRRRRRRRRLPRVPRVPREGAERAAAGREHPTRPRPSSTRDRRRALARSTRRARRLSLSFLNSNRLRRRGLSPRPTRCRGSTSTAS
eukprot:31298-Pelagococcus_subviridis.AAC.3